MKILWLVNIVMPELAVHLGEKPSVFGGWLSGALDAVRSAGHGLTICTTRENAHEVRFCPDLNTTYLLLDTKTDFSNVLRKEEPDLVHIWGTEFPQAWALASVSDPSRTLVSVQGFVHTYENHVFAGIPEHICRTNRLHRLLNRMGKHITSIEQQRLSFLQRSDAEIRVLKRVGHVNGGTAWGDGCSQLQQPGVQLHKCGLILRSSFYGPARWDPDAAEPHSIFTIYTYPIKGFHKFLEALRLVADRYPDTKVYVAGNKCAFRRFTGLRKWIMDHAPDYDWYVQGLIERYGLRDNLVFLGYLSEEQMHERLLHSSVFVSASSIENHSTALGEAMILGVPSVASCVGGLQEMIDHGRDGFLYPFDETYTMAHQILRLFEDRALAEQFSRLGHIHAARTYDREQNRIDLLAMYDKIGGADK